MKNSNKTSQLALVIIGLLTVSACTNHTSQSIERQTQEIATGESYTYVSEEQNPVIQKSGTIDISNDYDKYLSISKGISGNGYVWHITNLSSQIIKKIEIRYTISWTNFGQRKEKNNRAHIFNLNPGYMDNALITDPESKMYPDASVTVNQILITY